METCEHGHDPICFVSSNKSCPLCTVIDENTDLIQRIKDAEAATRELQSEINDHVCEVEEKTTV